MHRHQEFHVARVVGILGRLEPLDLGEGGLVHRRHQHVVRVGVVRGAARHHVRDDQPLEMLLVRERVLEGENAAPRVAEQIEVGAIEVERLADLFELFDEPG